MQLIELKNKLIQKEVSSLYVFTGPEVAIMEVYLRKIVTLHGGELIRAENVQSVFRKLQSNSLTSTKSCYVISNDKDFLQQEKAWQALKAGKIQGLNTVILTYANLDKRGKFYKQLADLIVDFPKLSTNILAKYIIKQFALNHSQAEQLAGLCDNDYSRILLEIDKLKHLGSACNLDAAAAYKLAIKNRLIHVNPKDAIFDFVDSVCQRQYQQSYQLLQDVVAIGEPPLVILKVLYTNIRAMLLVRGAAGSSDVSKSTGLTPFQIKLAKEKGNNYSVGELVRALRILREAERGIKIGKLPAELATEYVLVNIL